MIKKAYDILIARWPEAVLIIGLMTMQGFSSNYLRSSDINLASRVLYQVFIIFIGIISFILLLGFQRTAYLTGSERQEPMVLLKTGKRFFWRFFGLALLLFPAFLILVLLFYSAVKMSGLIESDFFGTTESKPWLFFTYICLIRLLLIKFLLFIPTLIVVLDCRVFDSFRFLKHCKLSQVPQLVVLYLISNITMGLLFFVNQSIAPSKDSNYFLEAIAGVINQSLHILTAVAAIMFVGSLNLKYNTQTELKQMR